MSVTGQCLGVSSPTVWVPGMEPRLSGLKTSVFTHWGIWLVLREHGLTMDMCEGNSECLWENRKRTRRKSWDLGFFKKSELLLEYAFMFLPGVAKQAWIYFRLLITTGPCSGLHASVEMHVCHVWPVCHMQLALVTVHFVRVTPTNTPSINCRMVWIKLANVWSFSQPHFWAPFSQVSQPLEQ